jgi:nucleoside-diphosphate-sugar epimerase
MIPSMMPSMMPSMIEDAGRLLHNLRDFVVEQFVFSSMMLAIADEGAENKPIPGAASVNEMDEIRNCTRAYSEVERFIQRELSPDRGNIPVVILRIADVYDENCHSLTIAQQISRIYEKRIESHFYSGDVDRGQPFIRLDDLTECFLKVIELRRELEPCEIFLIAEPDILSYAELQEQIGELLHGEEWTTIPIPRIVAKVGAWAQENIFRKETAIMPETVDRIDTRYSDEIERTNKRLGWQPQHSLRDTLSKIIGSLKENPHRWYETNNLSLPGEET